jgi:hypothetical protein
LLRWYRRFRPRWFWKATSPLGAVTLRYVDQFGLSVRRGPFAGLTFPPKAVGASGFLPAKLLGCYEAEVVETILSLDAPDTFVDIGSGDGYYPVAIARLNPRAKVIGFETDGRERRLAGELTSLNGVSVDLYATATASALNTQLPHDGGLLILCDIEGAEDQVLEPQVVPRLREASMIVELHPRVVPDIEAKLRARFEATHKIRMVHEKDRSIDLPELSGWSPADANYAVTDGRPEHGLWMVLEPLAGDRPAPS